MKAANLFFELNLLILCGLIFGFFLSAKTAFLILLVVSLIFLFPQKQNLILTISGILSWFVIKEKWVILFEKEQPFVQLLTLLIMSLGISFLTLKFRKKITSFKIIMCYMAVYLLLVYLKSAKVESEILALMFDSFYSIRVILIYLAFAVTYFKNKDITSSTFSEILFPFWSIPAIFVPIPSFANNSHYKYAIGTKNIIKIKSALVCLFSSLICFFLLSLINWIIFKQETKIQIIQYLPSLNLESFESGFSNCLKSHVHFWQKWIAIVGSFLKIYLYGGMGTFGIVALARLCGYNIPTMINRPWKAKSFMEYYQRILFYLGNIFQYIFIPPFYQLFQFIKNNRFRKFLIIFSSYFIGSLVIHFLMDAKNIQQTSVTDVILYFLQSSLYFCILALLIATESVVYRRGQSGVIINVFRTIVLSLVYSSYVALYHTSSDLLTYFEYIRGLFIIRFV